MPSSSTIVSLKLRNIVELDVQQVASLQETLHSAFGNGGSLYTSNPQQALAPAFKNCGRLKEWAPFSDPMQTVLPCRRVPQTGPPTTVLYTLNNIP